MMRVYRVLAVFLFCLAVSGLFKAQTVIAQGQLPTQTPPPNPTIVALEEKVGDLEKEVALLNERKDVDKQSLENQIQQELLPVYVWFAVLSALGISSAFGAWTWIRSFTENTRKKVEEDTRRKLDQAFYNADPLYYPIYVPRTGFDVEKKRLEKLGFKDLRDYGGLNGTILNGIVIIRIPGENFRENREEQAQAESALTAFETFYNEHHAESKKIAFVLYITGGQLGKASELAAKYENVVIANMPVTTAEHIYALVRGLTTPETKKEDGS